MTRQSTLPSLREQARHALLLLGVPAPARLVADVHAAFFDGDLSVPGLAALMREDERSLNQPPPFFICPALQHDLAPSRGIVTLSTWSVEDRLSSPALARAHALVATVRIAEFAAVRAGAGACAHDLLRRLAADVPGGPEAPDLAEAARAALDDPALAAAAAAEEPARLAALDRAEHLDERHRLFGVPALPHQRGPA